MYTFAHNISICLVFDEETKYTFFKKSVGEKNSLSIFFAKCTFLSVAVKSVAVKSGAVKSGAVKSVANGFFYKNEHFAKNMEKLFFFKMYPIVVF